VPVQPVRPRIVASKCLGFAACRWNGVLIEDALVERLRPHVDFHPVCPEMEIGLGCPRQPIRVVRHEKTVHLQQPATGRDVTPEMTAFVGRFLGELTEVDGFLLKYKSPSCGIANVKIYSDLQAKSPCGRGAGVFGSAVRTRFPDLPVEDEGRLLNFSIREHYLTRIFTLARFRRCRESCAMRDLVDFHATHKYLLMACNQTALRRLGRLVANPDRLPPHEVLCAYRQELGRALARPPRFTSAINVLMHAFGHVSDRLTPKEKTFFLDSLEEYRAARIPLSVPVGLLQSWVIRFADAYLGSQVFFEPYPRALVAITDSGKGRDLT